MSMQKAMWKYPLLPGPGTYEMPKGAEIQSVAYVGGEVVAYALVTPPVDIKKDMEQRDIYVAMTGEMVEIRHLGRLIGTVVRRDGLVCHVWEPAMNVPDEIKKALEDRARGVPWRG